LDFANDFRGDDITEQLRKEWIGALLFLEHELGGDFFKNCGLTHPLFFAVNNTSHGGLWAMETLIDLSKTLEKLKASTTTYPKLLKKLRSSNRCQAEGMPFIQIAAMYLQAGLEIHFVEEAKLQKTADIEVRNPATGEKFYIEVSKLNNSEITEESGRSYAEFRKQFPVLYDTWHSCYQMRNFKGEEIKEVVQTILIKREDMLSEDKVLYYKDNNIKLIIAPFSKKGEFDQLCNSKNMRNGVHGIPLAFDETQRISNNKLPQKCQQIPTGYSGIIYVPVNQIYLWVVNPNKAIMDYQKQLKRYPNILGVVMYGDTLNPENSYSTEGGEYIFTNKMLNHGILRKMLFVKNPIYDDFLSADAIAKIYSTLCI